MNLVVFDLDLIIEFCVEDDKMMISSIPYVYLL